MSDSPPIPEPLWQTVPPEAQAALRAQFAALERRIADLQERVHRNSTNSSRPPSSDPASVKRRPPAPPSGKKRGGQPGHRHHPRALLPPEQRSSSASRRSAAGAATGCTATTRARFAIVAAIAPVACRPPPHQAQPLAVPEGDVGECGGNR